TRLRCFGEVRRGPSGLEIVHPEYRRVAESASTELEETLTPVYPLTEGLTQGRLRALVTEALRELRSAGVRDWIPGKVMDSLGLPSLQEALEYVHRPPQEAQIEVLEAGRHPAQRRLAFEELLAHHLSLKLIKHAAKTEPAWELEDREGLARRVVESPPFPLPKAQASTLREVEGRLG